MVIFKNNCKKHKYELAFKSLVILIDLLRTEPTGTAPKSIFMKYLFALSLSVSETECIMIYVVLFITY